MSKNYHKCDKIDTNDIIVLKKNIENYDMKIFNENQFLKKLNYTYLFFMNIKDDILTIYLKSLSKIIVYIEEYDNYYFLSKIDKNNIRHFNQDNNLEKFQY